MRVSLIVLLAAVVAVACAKRSQEAPEAEPAMPANFYCVHPLDSELLPVAEGAPDRSILDSIAADLRASYARTGEIAPRLRTWEQISGDAIEALFPEHRFYVISWDEEQADPDGPTVNCAIGLHFTVALDETEKTFRFHGSGNYEHFGEFLHRQGIRIEDRGDALVVWDAFCEIHRKAWGDQGVEKPAVRDEWHLGVTTIDGTTYRYEVATESDGTVRSGKLHTR